jgi:hypothetical protein
MISAISPDLLWFALAITMILAGFLAAVHE